MVDDDIRWSPRPWSLSEFPRDLHPRLRRLARNRPLLTEQINGDGLYVRRISVDAFQSGLGIWNPRNVSKRSR